MKILPATLPITEPGFYELTAAQYHADPCELSLSRGVAELLVERSPSHAKLAHPKLSPQGLDNSTHAMKLGSAIHDMVLGGGPEFEVNAEHSDYKTKAAREWRDDVLLRGKIPMLEDSWRQATSVAEAVRAVILASEIGNAFTAGQKEVTSVWKVGEVWLRSRFDCLFVGEREVVILDLKSTTDASMAALTRKAQDYAMQVAFYTAAVESLLPQMAGRIRFIFPFVEVTPPYGVQIVELDEIGHSIGHRKFERAVSLWQRCVREDRWPGYPNHVQSIQTPAWAIHQDMVIELVEGE